MKIEDTVRAAVDEARFNALVQKLRDAKEAPILPAAAPKVVELAAKEFNIRQNESEGILGHLIAGGDLSLYGLANAVTRHAQDVQSYDRSTELEATGYKIITMQPALLKRWNEEVIFESKRQKADPQAERSPFRCWLGLHRISLGSGHSERHGAPE